MRHTWTGLRWRGLLMLTATLCVASAWLIAPSGATAFPMSSGECDPDRLTRQACSSDRYLVASSHVGWVYLDLNFCPSDRFCATIYRDRTAAWRWTGTTWQQTSIRGGSVYVYPYSKPWRWAWTQESGWVAVHDQRFVTGRYFEL